MDTFDALAAIVNRDGKKGVGEPLIHEFFARRLTQFEFHHFIMVLVAARTTVYFAGLNVGNAAFADNSLDRGGGQVPTIKSHSTEGTHC